MGRAGGSYYLLVRRVGRWAGGQPTGTEGTERGAVAGLEVQQVQLACSQPCNRPPILPLPSFLPSP